MSSAVQSISPSTEGQQLITRAIASGRLQPEHQPAAEHVLSLTGVTGLSGFLEKLPTPSSEAVATSDQMDALERGQVIQLLHFIALGLRVRPDEARHFLRTMHGLKQSKEEAEARAAPEGVRHARAINALAFVLDRLAQVPGLPDAEHLREAMLGSKEMLLNLPMDAHSFVTIGNYTIPLPKGMSYARAIELITDALDGKPLAAKR